MSAVQSSRADRRSYSVTSVGAAELVSHVYERMGLGLRRARIKLLVVV